MSDTESLQSTVHTSIKINKNEKWHVTSVKYLHKEKMPAWQQPCKVPENDVTRNSGLELKPMLILNKRSDIICNSSIVNWGTKFRKKWQIFNPQHFLENKLHLDTFTQSSGMWRVTSP